jgi:threonine synthase
MTLSEGLALTCGDCDWRGRDRDAGRCPDCGRQLAPVYDADAFRGPDDDVGVATFEAARLRPTDTDAAATLGEGGTPLVECQTLADELDVDTFAIKDEGHNPTGTLADRAIAAAVTAAIEGGADHVTLPTTGADGVAAAAYAARAGADAHVFVPTRSTHTTKAMINVHDGDMSVVEGRLPDATEAFRSAVEEEDWTPIDPGNAPLRAAGLAPILPELLADLEGQAPDAVVVPTASGEALAGLHAAARLLVDLGVLDDVPVLFAVQAEGCAPIVRAVDEGADADDSDAVEAWDSPDTISGALEVTDPAFGTQALQATEASGGGAVAVDDEAILASACQIAAAEGLEVSVAGGAAAAGAWELSNQGVFGPHDVVVLLNTGAGSLDSDVLRSHLMRAG